MIALGWDPGVKYLAYGVVDLGPTRSRCLANGIIGDKLGDMPISERLDEMSFAIDGILNTWMPDVCGYEDQTGVSIAMEAAGKSNVKSRRIHEVVGMIRFAARCSLSDAVPVYSVQPRSMKIGLLGKGHSQASKEQVQWAVERFFGVKTNQHAADAIGIAVVSARLDRLASAQRRRSGATIT
jgi:Holliday junction resolvasome RuvABC endonuclease subunit